MVGPAAIATILVSQQSFGYLPTFVFLVVNMTLVFLGLMVAPFLLRVMGRATAKAIAKVASLFLAAIAVAMIRAGVTGMLGG